MAQKQVTDFFLSRKRGGQSYHASKRLKISANSAADATVDFEQKPCAKEVQYADAINTKDICTIQATNLKLLEGTNTATVSKNKSKCCIKTEKKVKQLITKDTYQLTQYLEKSLVEKDTISASDTDSEKLLTNSEPSISIATAVSDDHGRSPASSPVKRIAATPEAFPCDSSKRGRTTASVVDVYKTPEKFDFAPYAKHCVPSEGLQLSSARKKLVLHHTVEKSQQLSPVFDFKGSSPEKVPACDVSTSKPASNNNFTVEKIGKCSNLSELRQKLAQFSGHKAKAESVFDRARQNLAKRDNLLVGSSSDSVEQKQACAAVKSPMKSSPVKSPAKSPAFQRYGSLAAASPPTFQLPYKYKVLGDTFKSSDTVVSMLTNRTEICTFSKLKAAVQEMTKRAFELAHLGQIKTVHPTAYHFRQEKDLPVFGGKESGYQLTIEPILDDSTVGTIPGNRVAFTATKLLERKNVFLHNLVNIVKKYHEEFLKKMKITVNEEDIKRWHPHFKLDDLPDVEPSELPQPPFVKKFSTAKDVLDEVKDKLNPRIQRALEVVSNKSRSPVKTESSVESSAVISQASANSDAERLKSFKGIPSSLLERVRAKQAKKLELEMTRSTEETKRLEMLQRLPDLTRILRTHFVTQKRPAVPVVDVIKSFTNSYKTAFGSVEAESHLKLMAEVVPEWMSIVNLKIGSFVKINRDIDLMSVHDKIEKLIKST